VEGVEDDNLPQAVGILRHLQTLWSQRMHYEAKGLLPQVAHHNNDLCSRKLSSKQTLLKLRETVIVIQGGNLAIGTRVYNRVADTTLWCNEVAGDERRERLENVRDTFLEALKIAETWAAAFWQAVTGELQVDMRDPQWLELQTAQDGSNVQFVGVENTRLSDLRIAG